MTKEHVNVSRHAHRIFQNRRLFIQDHNSKLRFFVDTGADFSVLSVKLYPCMPQMVVKFVFTGQYFCTLI